MKWNNGKISVLVYRKPTDQYLHYSSQHQQSCEESVVFSLFSKAYSIIANKDDLAQENAKNNIFDETDRSNFEAVYFGESKRSLKSRSGEHKRSVKNWNCEKIEIEKHCWEAEHNFSGDQKKVVDRESRLVRRKIKETIYYLKNLNYINKICYLFPEIWMSPCCRGRSLSDPSRKGWLYKIN